MNNMNTNTRANAFTAAATALTVCSSLATAQDYRVHLIDPHVSGEELSSVTAADLNGDGRIDTIAASASGGTIGWSAQLPPAGDDTPVFAEYVELVTGATGIGALIASDIDADGDVDLLYTSPTLGRAAWLENDGAAAPGFTEHVLVDGLAGASDVEVGDADDDGDLDVFVAAQVANTVLWLESDGGADPAFTQHVIDASATGAVNLDLADMDGDGDLDVVTALGAANMIVQYTNSGAAFPSFARETLVEETILVRDVKALDADDDGDIDIISHINFVPDSFDVAIVFLHENTDGAFSKPPNAPEGPYGTDLRVLFDSDGVFGLRAFIGDTDGDHLPDVYALESLVLGRKDVLIDVEIQTGFRNERAIVAGGDVDGDGDLDLIQVDHELNPFGSGTHIWWIESRVVQNASTGKAFPSIAAAMEKASPGDSIVSSPLAVRNHTGEFKLEPGMTIRAARMQFGSDVDLSIADQTRLDSKDDFVDPEEPRPVDTDVFAEINVIAGASSALNGSRIDLNGSLVLEPGSKFALEAKTRIRTGSPFRTQKIHHGSEFSSVGVAADFDVDGDMDMYLPYGGVTMINRTIETGSFQMEPKVTEQSDLIEFVVSDVDGDGIPDIVGLREGDIVALRNLGAFEFEEFAFETTLGEDPELFVADLNGDERLDLVAFSYMDNVVNAFIFTGADTPELTLVGQFMNTELYERGIVDLDADGGADLIVFTDDTVDLLRNSGGATPSFTREDLAGPDVFFGDAADVNHDGAIDLLVSSAGAGSGTPVYWLLNDPGGEPWTKQIPVATPQLAGAIRAADYDGDGDIDVIIQQEVPGFNLRDIAVAEHNGSANSPYSGAEVAYEGGYLSTIENVSGDDALDIVFSDSDGIRWLENVTRDKPLFHERALLISHRAQEFSGSRTSFPLATVGTTTFADFDLDGFPDVLLVPRVRRAPLEIYFGGHTPRMNIAEGATLIARSDLELEVIRHEQVDLSAGEIRMEAPMDAAEGGNPEIVDGVLQLEVLSSNLGPSSIGFDRTALGSYPIGTLRIGPNPTCARLIDSFENDGRTLDVPEALYVDQLIVHAGSKLETNGIAVYYREAVLAGEVDHIADLRRVRDECPWDLSGDGFVDALDLASLLSWWGSEGTPLDFGGDGEVNAVDIAELLSRWGACE